MIEFSERTGLHDEILVGQTNVLSEHFRFPINSHPHRLIDKREDGVGLSIHQNRNGQPGMGDDVKIPGRKTNELIQSPGIRGEEVGLIVHLDCFCALGFSRFSFQDQESLEHFICFSTLSDEMNIREHSQNRKRKDHLF
jgi:hypothetical protein